MFLTASAGLLAREAEFREKHGDDFTSWVYDRLVTAVVRKICMGNQMVTSEIRK